jgi:Leucine-rich repeat (LRR) protein
MELPFNLKGKDINNEEITIEITNIRRFGIERQNLSSIDLSPLESLENKEQVISFVAHENFLEKIDLSFLKGCKNLSVLYLFSNNLKEIDLTPLKYCSKLNKLNLHDNYLNRIDLTPLESCKELKGLWLHNNELESIDLSPVSKLPELKRIGLDKTINLENSLIPKEIESIIELNEEQRQERYLFTSEQDSDSEYYDESEDYFISSGRSPNDQRSDVMNPNNPEYQDASDNRANQLNPQHREYRSSRGKK